MKKLITLALVLCIGAFSGSAFGQQKDTQKNEKKGGFAVGGYDAAKQQQTQEVKKRSVNLNEEIEASEKAAETVPPPAPIPPPPPPPPAQKIKQDDKENVGQVNTNDKEKQKVKKNSRSKGRR